MTLCVALSLVDNINAATYPVTAYVYESSYGKVRKYHTASKKYQLRIYFGAIRIADEHCLAYMRFYEILQDFHERASTGPSSV